MRMFAELDQFRSDYLNSWDELKQFVMDVDEEETDARDNFIHPSSPPSVAGPSGLQHHPLLPPPTNPHAMEGLTSEDDDDAAADGYGAWTAQMNKKKVRFLYIFILLAYNKKECGPCSFFLSELNSASLLGM